MFKREVSRYIFLALCLALLMFSAVYALQEVAAGTVAEYNSQHNNAESAAIAPEHGTLGETITSEDIKK